MIRRLPGPLPPLRNLFGGKGRAVAAAAALVAGAAAVTLLPARPGSHRPVRVVIPAGTGLLGIAGRLQAAGVVRSAAGFALLAVLTGQGHRLEAGTYRFTPGESPLAVLDQLARGAVAVERLTVVPGMTVRQVAVLLARLGVASVPQVMAAARRSAPPPGFALPAGVRDPLEGFIPPATYGIPWGARLPQVLALFRAHFARFFPAAWRVQARARGLTPLQVLTLASIVEREVSSPAARPLVAAVFLHRLRLGWPLQSDATVLYAQGDRGSLTPQSLARASPYNTYRVRGLPPGPICNPSQASVRAVLEAPATSDLFFVTLPSGRTVFLRTYAQQQRLLHRLKGP